MHLLIVEDESEAAAALAHDLSELGHSVAIARDGRDAIFIANDEKFDAIILDRMLPLVDGLDVVKQLRRTANLVPLVMLTALGDLAHRIEGLEGGADDYIVKPIDSAELNARLHAVVRRSLGSFESGMLAARGIEMNLLRQTVRVNGKLLALKSIEFGILRELLTNIGNIVTKSMLLESVWGYHFEPDSNIVEMHMHRLRARLRLEEKNEIVVTIRGSGYIIYGT